LGVFKESLNLLNINCHVLSGDNHNPMLIEHVNIMTNKRDSIQIPLEAILLLIYAWNSCPVLGTDISRSLVAVRHEFSFPIDFSAGTTRSLRLHLVPLLPILATLLSASTHVRISLN
jgi:hypothetical protein